MTMNYRQLQIALKELRAQGITVFCKLNDRKDVLQAEYNRLQYTSPWDNQDDVDFDDDTDCILNSDTVDDWSECFDTLPSDVFYTDTELDDSIEGNPSIDYNEPSLLDMVENDSQLSFVEFKGEVGYWINQGYIPPKGIFTDHSGDVYQYETGEITLLFLSSGKWLGSNEHHLTEGDVCLEVLEGIGLLGAVRSALSA